MFAPKNCISLLLILAGALAGGPLRAGTGANETETDNSAPGGKLRMPPLETAASPAANVTNLFTIFMVGDSTMANKPVVPEYPERGWGQMLPQYFKSGVRIENHAMNGRSSKSFLDEGRWAVVTNRLQPGDWVIIQFGHNDEKRKDPKRFTEPFGSYETNLVKFITETRAHGANPVLCTSIARRDFNAAGNLVDTHGDYIKAAREVAVAQGVPLLDLNKRTDELLRRLGPDRSKVYYDWFTTNDFPGLKKNITDDTHLNATGASRVCDFAVEEILASAPGLALYLNTAK
jgi:lysophospholipase L1-like esterase